MSSKKQSNPEVDELSNSDPPPIAHTQSTPVSTGLGSLARLPLEIRHLMYTILIRGSSNKEPLQFFGGDLPNFRDPEPEPDRLAEVSATLAAGFKPMTKYVTANTIFTIERRLNNRTGLPIEYSQMSILFSSGHPWGGPMKKLAFRTDLTTLLPRFIKTTEDARWRKNAKQLILDRYPCIDLLYVRVILVDIEAIDIDNSVRALKHYFSLLEHFAAPVRFQLSARYCGEESQIIADHILKAVDVQQWPEITFVPDDGTNGDEKMVF